MDPFTQKMLERAKARREKLNTQLSNAGHDVSSRRSPLKDANAILAQASVNKTKSPAKSPKISKEVIPTKSPKKSFLDKTVDTENDNYVNKENGEVGVYNVKSKLQRLGKLYSDENGGELSSPIHRTEEKFSEEENTELKSMKKCARLDRLAALASTINNWEDDLSHPSAIKPVISKAEKVQAKFNEQVKHISELQPSTSNCTSNILRGSQEPSPTKDWHWDRAVLENLEAQGFTRTSSNSRLVYDYKSSPQKDKCSPKKMEKKSSTTELIPEEKPQRSTRCEIINVEKKVHPTKNYNTQENVNKKANTGVQSDAHSNSAAGTNFNNNGNRLTPRSGFNAPPVNSHHSPGSVLSLTSIFEAKNSDTKTKDPAQMTLLERKALFERNKGEAPLLPKAPLTMSVPLNKLYEKEKSNTDSSNVTNQHIRAKCEVQNKVVAQRAVFEQGGAVQELENNILRNTQLERQRELDMLRSRFNRNREMAQAAAGSCIRTSESSEGTKPNSPKNSPVCPVKPTPAPDHSNLHPPPPPPLPSQGRKQSCTNNTFNQNKGTSVKRQVTISPPKTQAAQIVSDVKRIRVSPPKPGNLYPNLSEIEVSETETDTEYTVESTEPETATFDEQTETATEAEYNLQDDESELCSSDDDEDTNSSLGRSILRVVNRQNIQNKKRSIDPDSELDTSDISVLEEMDEYLDECLAIQELRSHVHPEGPTPPKLNKGGKSPSTSSTSFKYSQGSPYRSPVKVSSSVETPKNEDAFVVEGDSSIPLMHSVSFYRRQQSQTPKTPARVVSRTVNYDDSFDDSEAESVKEEATLVQEKIKRLLDEVCKQQTIIGQASQALNLCTSTVEFSGSREQVEGERLLLVATHKRQAALNEVQRLKVEGTLRPVTPGSPEIEEKGSLTISAITLPLKREFVRCMDPNKRHHFVCLVRHLDEIIATPVVVAEPGDSCIRFPSTLKLQDLYSDFKITIETYSLQTKAEMLPHEVKYHIHSNGNSGGSSSKKGAGKTPKKYLKQESRLLRPTVQSPAGPSAVRSPAFALSGYVIFSLKEVQRQQFTMSKVPRESPLEGRLQMHVSCELSVSVEHRGFLTMFEDVSGFGAWHRRWCLLKGAMLSYWKYPDDERKKTPIGTLDLQGVVTSNVGLVSRDICARLNTFLLETVRPSQPGDEDTLVMVRNGSQTTIRHLLSADTKEERLEWCSKLNKTLNLIRAWGNPPAVS